MALFAGAARRAASATALWTIPSVAISNTVLPALGASGHIWSPATVTAGVTAACLGVLFPLGAARGGLNAVEHLVVPAVGDSVANVAVASTSALGGDANTSAQRGAAGLRTRLEEALSSNDSLHANVMNNTGASGMLTRAAIAMFLPRIDVLMDHVVLASASASSASSAAATNNLYGVDRATASKGGSTGSGVDGALSSSATTGGGDDVGTLVRVATNGLVAGQIAGARDKVTGLGLIVFSTIVAVTMAADRTAAGVAAKKERVVEQYDAAKETAQQRFGEAKDQAVAAGARARAGFGAGVGAGSSGGAGAGAGAGEEATRGAATGGEAKETWGQMEAAVQENVWGVIGKMKDMAGGRGRGDT